MEALAREAAAGLAAAAAPRAVLDDFLRRSGAEASSAALRAEVERLQQQADEGDWIVGRTGGGRTAEAQRETTAGQYRDDEILWLREERVRRYGLRALPQLGAAVDRLVEALQPQLDPSLRWELGGRTTQMVACYHPGSAGYSYHVDNPDHDGRVITAILYLNADWAPGDGGELAIHPDDGSGSSTVAPAAGRLVVFDSRTEHEVLEFRGRERWAITGFLYRAETAVSPPPSHGPKILVAIASYRDEECPHTVDALYASAKTPQRVSVAVLDQSEPADGDCVSAEARETFGAQIGVHRMHWSKAKGPCWVSVVQTSAPRFFAQASLTFNRRITCAGAGAGDAAAVPGRRRLLPPDRLAHALRRGLGRPPPQGELAKILTPLVLLCTPAGKMGRTAK